MSYDLKNVNLEDKAERSKFIGKQQINNTNLSAFLIQATENLIETYLRRNHVKDEDIIITQRDGLISRTMLEDTDKFLELKFRGFVEFMVLSFDRMSYLACIDGKIEVKGVRDYYDALDVIYQKFSKLGFYDKTSLFKQFQMIKDSVFTHDDISLFLIPRTNNKHVVVTYKDGPIEIGNTNMVDLSDIDRNRYFNHYFKPFLDSLYLECY